MLKQNWAASEWHQNNLLLENQEKYQVMVLTGDVLTVKAKDGAARFTWEESHEARSGEERENKEERKPLGPGSLGKISVKFKIKQHN